MCFFHIHHYHKKSRIGPLSVELLLLSQKLAEILTLISFKTLPTKGSLGSYIKQSSTAYKCKLQLQFGISGNIHRNFILLSTFQERMSYIHFSEKKNPFKLKFCEHLCTVISVIKSNWGKNSYFVRKLNVYPSRTLKISISLSNYFLLM